MLKYLLVGIPTVLIAFIVPAVIMGMTEKVNTTSLNKFVMRLSKGVAVIGALLLAFIGFVLFIAIKQNQINSIMIVLFILFFLLALFLLLAPSKGFYEYKVDGDILTGRQFWVLKERISIKEIRQCTIVNGGIKVYVNGKDKPVMSIESIFKNSKNFIKRMQEENIPVINNATGFWNEQE